MYRLIYIERDRESESDGNITDREIDLILYSDEDKHEGGRQ